MTEFAVNLDAQLERYKQFKEFQKRILVATDLFGRGIDIERDSCFDDGDLVRFEPDVGEAFCMLFRVKPLAFDRALMQRSTS